LSKSCQKVDQKFSKSSKKVFKKKVSKLKSTDKFIKAGNSETVRRRRKRRRRRFVVPRPGVTQSHLVKMRSIQRPYNYCYTKRRQNRLSVAPAVGPL
jgi:hypothetical protein